MSEPVSVGLLGPIEAWRGGRRLSLGGRRQRGLLAVLAMNAGRVATAAELVDAVWGESPPATARQQLHSAVSALRRALGGVIVTRQAGYELGVPTESVDVFAFDALVVRARREASSARLEVAVDRFRRTFHYPPYTRMVQILARDRDRQRAEDQLRDLAGRVARHPHARDIRVSGPAPAAFERLRGRWRFQLLLRAESGTRLRRLIRDVLPERPAGELVVDVDPYQLL